MPNPVEEALDFHKAGRLAEAEARYRQLLEFNPNQLGVLQLLGMLLHQQGKFDQAALIYQHILQVDPHQSDAHNNLGTLYRQLGLLAEAERAYQQALQLDPEFVMALSNLGIVYKEQGRLDQAVECYQQALSLHPDYAQAHFNLGNAFFAQGRWKDAIQHYRRVLSLQPEHVEAWIGLGNALCEQGELGQGIQAYQQGVRSAPQHAGLFHNIGNALGRQGKPQEALVYYQQALALQPDYAEVHYNIANLFLDQGQPQLAQSYYQQALLIRPEYVHAWVNLGNSWMDRGLLTEALSCFRKALELDPTYAVAHLEHGFALLLAGDLAEGFAEYTDYEWCLWRKEKPALSLVQPEWEGFELNGQWILLHLRHAGALGDAIQFVRYASWVAERGGRVVVECPPELVRLFETVPGVERVIAEGEELPPVVTQVALPSLPKIFRTRLETIPTRIPYVRVPAEATVFLSDGSTPEGSGLKIGLVWAGAPRYRNPYRIRSFPVALWQERLPIPGIRFFSLQKGQVNPDLRPDLIGDLSPQLQDFAATAAAVAQMDLIISVDTSVAHLAGALGKPVWVLLPYAPDWRWMLNREDSPWYPSMRLFRQPDPGNWSAVLDHVVQALNNRVVE